LIKKKEILLRNHCTLPVGVMAYLDKDETTEFQKFFDGLEIRKQIGKLSNRLKAVETMCRCEGYDGPGYNEVVKMMDDLDDLEFSMRKKIIAWYDDLCDQRGDVYEE
jgi:hypothetical protein